MKMSLAEKKKSFFSFLFARILNHKNKISGIFGSFKCFFYSFWLKKSVLLIYSGNV